MRSYALNRFAWFGLTAGFVLVACNSARPLAAREPIRLAAQPVGTTLTFEPEGRPIQLEDQESPPAAMTTVGGGESWVTCLAFSPGGQWLAVGDRPNRPLCNFLGAAPINENGGLIRIVDVAARRVVRTIGPAKKPRHEYDIVRLAYTSDGRTLVAHGKEVWPTGDGPREVRYHLTAWDADTGRMLRRIDSTKGDDWTLATFSGDASTFATRTHSGIRVWDIATGRERPAPTDAPAEPEALALSPDAKILAASDGNGTIGLWDAASGRRIGRFPGHRPQGKAFQEVSLVFSPDSRSLACVRRIEPEDETIGGAPSSEVRLIDLATDSERERLPSLEKALFRSAAFSPDGTTIATASSREYSPDSPDEFTGTITLWDAVTRKPRLSVNRVRQPEVLGYTPDGSLLVTADRLGIVLRDSTDARERIALRPNGLTGAITVSPDGRTLASSDGRLQLWNLRAASAPQPAGGHRFGVTCLAYASDGRTLASGSLDRTIKLWDIARRRPRATLLGHEENLVQLAFAPDGQTLASVDVLGLVRVWDAMTGACRFVLQGPNGRTRLLTFAPDGRTLSVVAYEYDEPVVVRWWDTATGARIPSPALPKDSPHPLAFSSDGGLFVAANKSRIEIREAATWVLRSSFSGERDPLALLVSRDGATVLQMNGGWSLAIYKRSDGVWNRAPLSVSQAHTFEMGSRIPGQRMAATPDGRRLGALVDNSVRVFETATRRSVMVREATTEEVTWLALAPDGTSLATGWASGDVLVDDLIEVFR